MGSTNGFLALHAILNSTLVLQRQDHRACQRHLQKVRRLARGTDSSVDYEIRQHIDRDRRANHTTYLVDRQL